MESISKGSFIKNARLAKGYSQQNLSDLTGIHHVSISRIETDKSIPRLSTLTLICSALDIDYNKAVVLRAKSL